MLSVSTGAGIAGMDYGDSNFVPAFPDAAAGPAHIVQVVTDKLAIYEKGMGNRIVMHDLDDFFAPVASSERGIANVEYDEDIERFVVISDDSSGLLYAVSDDRDPTVDTNGDGSSFSEMHRVSFAPGLAARAKSLGRNADAHVVITNLFQPDPLVFDRQTLIAFDKSTVTDADPTTFTFNSVDLNLDVLVTPATMHESSPGDPLWVAARERFVIGGEASVGKITDLLTTLSVEVSPFGEDLSTTTPNATQPGGEELNTFRPSFKSPVWRNNTLVAAADAPSSTGQENEVRWYEFDTSSGSAVLTQQGALDPGPGVHNYFPSIDVAPNGDIGLTYMQSSDSEYISMYVTGRKSSDTVGAMQMPLVAKAGEATYVAFDTPPYNIGQYTGIAIDPTDGSFWAVSQYATSESSSENWGTWIANFSLDDAVTVFADSFENGQWNGKWIEDAQDDWFTSTQRSSAGIYSAEVDGRANDATLTMATPIDLSGYQSAELRFDWLIESSFDSGEYVALDVSTDGGGNWDHLALVQLNGNNDLEDVWRGEAINLTPYLSSNVLVRFRANANRANKDANVDNVRIVASGTALPQAPTIASLSAAPDPVVQGDTLTLTAGGVADSDGSVTSVAFYRDANGNGSLDVGTDSFVDSDIDGNDGWSVDASTAGLALGNYTYFAQATDNDGLLSDVAATLSEVIQQPTGSSNDIYVSFIDFETRDRGKGTVGRIFVKVLNDFDGNGADAGDLGAANVWVSLLLTETSTGKVTSVSGYTDASGVFRSNWIQGINKPDKYTINVIDLEHDTFQWNMTLDQEDDSDGIAGPDEVFMVG